MTDKEIIKALECCGDADCDNCPYSGDDLLRPCNDNLVKDTIDLINRQKAEIERLEQELFDRSLTIETWKWEAIKEFAERLIQEDGYNNHTFDDCASILVPAEYRKGREEKIKEVWELIKEIKKRNGG